ncbi:MAG: amidohydrolase [Lachnospiraceae bacterium]|nr:amidohydrolase [Lachnospiraceae bacterium]
MNIRFYNARIMTMKAGCEISEGELWVKDNRICYVGDSDTVKPAAPPWDRQIDCEGNLLMPGFKNGHTHSGMTVFRSLCDDYNLQDWLNQEIFPREAKMTGEDCYTLTKLAVLEYLTSGITAIGDMYLTPETIADACIHTGMRCVLVSGLNKFGPALSVMEDRYNQLNKKHPLITYQMGIHAEYTCSRELLEEVSALIRKYKAPFYSHMSETKAEVDECMGRYGITPAKLFEELGLLEFGGCVYHGVHVTPEDIAILKKHDISVITNPASNAKLASGIAPIGEYLKAGVNVGIGTDGASSNNCLDMFREMFLTTALAKLKENDPAAVDALKVLRMATVNGALSMGLTECDVLEEGKLADIIMIDLHQPNMQPLNNIAKNIVYSGSKTNIKMTMIDGKILYENGQFADSLIPEDIYLASNDILERLR